MLTLTGCFIISLCFCDMEDSYKQQCVALMFHVTFRMEITKWKNVNITQSFTRART